MFPGQAQNGLKRHATLLAAGLFVAGTALALFGAEGALSQQSSGLRGTLSGSLVERTATAGRTTNPEAEPDPTTTASTSIRPRTSQAAAAASREAPDIFPEPVEARSVTSPTAEGPAARPIAELEDLTTGTTRAQPLEDLEMDDMRREGPESVRLGPIEGLDRPADPTPFAPVGIRLGNFDLFPSIEQGIGHISNTGGAAGSRSSTVSETALRLEARSDWGRHSANITGTGVIRRAIAGAPVSELEGNVDARFRLELPGEFSATGGFAYDLRPESANAPEALADVARRPNRHVLTGTAGLAKDEGLARFAITGRLERSLYENARLTDDTIVSQRERNSTLASLSLRGGYAISPALRPFVEGEIGRRLQDIRIDSSGFARSANRYALRGGLELDLGEKLSGELAAGWLTERPDDANLNPISGLSLQGNIDWSPVRGTTVTLAGSTTVEGSTAPGETGTLLYAGSLTLARELRSNLTGQTTFGIDYRRYPGSPDHDITLRGEASLTWWLNRYAGLVGRVRHERFTSSQPNRNNNETSVYLGLRAQR